MLSSSGGAGGGAPPAPSSASGGRRVVDNMIQYTPEYYAFMRKLEEFHRRMGTSLLKEPVLGGKRLDLKKIYEAVLAHGGYHKVTADRAWKTICNSFDFPSTCTNAAYVMRNIYDRNLEQFEQEDHWGRAIVPRPRTDSPRSVRASPSAAAIDRAGADSADEGLRRGHSGAGFPPAKRQRLEEAPAAKPVKPIAYQPIEIPLNTLPTRLSIHEEEHFLDGGPQNRILLALKSGLPNEIDWAFNKLLQHSFMCQESFSLDMIPGLLDTLMSFAAPFFKHDVPAVPLRAHTNNVPAASSTAKLFNSENFTTQHVAVEADGAPATSVTTSSLDSGNLASIGHHQFAPECNAAQSGTLGSFFFEAFDSQDTQRRRDRAIEVLHIIRNFSFLESNARALVSHEDLRRILLRGLGLAVGTQHLEIRHACLDIVENVAPHIVLRSRHDPLQLRLRSLAHDTDRALCLGAIRSLTRLAGNDLNENYVIPLPPVLVRRLLQLLLVWDEGIVSAVLDMFYQYSSFASVDMSAYVARHAPGNIVRVLIKFLSWKVTVKPLPLPPSGPAPYFASQLPVGTSPGIRRAVNAPLPAPLSTAMPVTSQSMALAVSTPTSELSRPRTLRAIYAAPPPPVMPASTQSPVTYQMISALHPPQLQQQWTQQIQQISTVAATGAAFTTLPATVGISVPGFAPSTVSVPSSAPDLNAPNPITKNMCQWEGCSERLPPGIDDDALFEHVVSAHLQPQEEPQAYVCRWFGCGKFSHGVGTADRRVAVAHLQTHRPLTRAATTSAQAGTSSGGHQLQYFRLRSSAVPHAVRMAGGSGAADLDGAVGIPLTTALVLRNLARSKKCQVLFVPYEGELTSLMTLNPRLAGAVCAILAELRT